MITPRTDAATFAGWIKVDDGTDSPWHTDRQEWTKAEVARQLERELNEARAALRELVDALDYTVTAGSDVAAMLRYGEADQAARKVLASAAVKVPEDANAK